MSGDPNVIRRIELVPGHPGPQGSQGASGPPGLTARGAYSSVTAYALNDVVTNAGSSYRALGATTGNAPTNATYWEVLAAAGQNGGGGGPSFTANSALAQYQVFCNDTTTGAIVAATPSKLLNGAAIVGVARVAVSSAATVTSVNAAFAGDSISVPSLAGGGCGVATITATGMLHAGDAGGFQVGTYDNAGNLSVRPVASVGKAAHFKLEPSVWGAFPNDPTQMVNNQIAIQAMYDSIPIAPGNASEDVHFRDAFYCAGEISIARGTITTFQGAPRGGTNGIGGKGALIFPVGSNGLVYRNAVNSGDGGDAQNSQCHSANIQFQTPNATGSRTDGMTVAVGDVKSVPGESRYVLLAMTAGVTGVTSPAAVTATIASVSSATPPVITTTAPHSFPAGALITIAGNAGANCSCERFKVLSPTSFSVYGARDLGVYPAGGTATAQVSMDPTDTGLTGHYAPFPQSLVQDGGVTWRWLVKDVTTRQLWPQNAATTRGDLVIPPYNPSYTFVCTKPGTTPNVKGGHPTAFNAPEFYSNKIAETSGTVEWSAICSDAILVTTAFVGLHNTLSVGHLGFVEHFTGDQHPSPGIPITNCNTSYSTGARCTSGAGGIKVSGSDSNGCSIDRAVFLGIGLGMHGMVGVGTWDASLAGTSVSDCYNDVSHGHGHISTAASPGIYKGCFHESILPFKITNGVNLVGGEGPVQIAKAVSGTQDGTLAQFDSPAYVGGRTRVQAVDPYGTLGLRANLDYADGTSIMGFATDDGDSWTHQLATTGPNDRGWMSFAQNSYNDRRNMIAYSGQRSPEGPGHFGLWFGQFVNNGAARTYVGYAAADFLSKAVRGGTRVQGDVFATNLANPGQFRWQIVTAQGTIGYGYQSGSDAAGWVALPSAVVSDQQKPINVFGDVWSSTTFGALLCTRGGTRGTMPTLGTLSTLVHNRARAWVPDTRVDDRTVMRSATTGGPGNGYQLDPASYPAWNANTPINANQIVHYNGHFFRFDVQYWAGPTNWLNGDRCTPLVSADHPFYGAVFRAHTVIGPDLQGAVYTSSGATQPIWAAGSATPVDGNIQWIQENCTTGTALPYFGRCTIPGGGGVSEGDWLSYYGSRINWVEQQLFTSNVGDPFHAKSSGLATAFSETPAPVAVTGAVSNGGPNLIRLTAVGHTFTTGDTVCARNVGGVPNANNTFTVTVISSSLIDLQGSTFAGAYTSGGTVAKVYRPTDHGFGVMWSRVGAGGDNLDTSWVQCSNGTQWSLLDGNPSLGYSEKIIAPGSVAYAVNTAFSTSDFGHEGIILNGGTTFTVTTPIDGMRTPPITNNSGGTVTILGFSVTTGQTIVCQYFGGTVAAWKKVSLF